MIARVYGAINAVGAALAQEGVAKSRLNSRDNYLYRSIDDVLRRLAPLLAQHRLCILPRVIERDATERQDERGGLLIAVTLRVALDLVSAEDGSCHTIEAYGEALDAGDKGTAKAMQSAYKYAVLQAFCVPSAQGEDADASSYRLKPASLPAEPAEGWTLWRDAVTARIPACATLEAIHALQEEHRTAFAALSRERPDLYGALGRDIAKRKSELGAAGWVTTMLAQDATLPPETASPVRRTTRAARAERATKHPEAGKRKPSRPVPQPRTNGKGTSDVTAAG